MAKDILVEWNPYFAEDFWAIVRIAELRSKKETKWRVPVDLQDGGRISVLNQIHGVKNIKKSSKFLSTTILRKKLRKIHRIRVIQGNN